MSELILCYVDSPWAYFTTQQLDKQWGDDWNDAPYEHNAGRPYDPVWHRHPRHRKPGQPLCPCDMCERDWDGEIPRWTITKVAFDADLVPPCYGVVNSSYSVEEINAKVVPWLRKPYEAHRLAIYAGTPLSEFTRLVQQAGGTVYLEAVS